MKQTSIFSYAFLFCVLMVGISSCKKDVSGCTNPAAVNYNPDATEDDGFCVINGCTNPNSDNYNPNANNDDGSCIISGCTNPAALNYNPEANNDDGSCQIKGCTDAEALNFNPDANVEDNASCFYRKDLFIGKYVGRMECDNELINQFLGGGDINFEIKEIPGEKNKVTVNFDFQANIMQSPEGTIDQNNVLKFKTTQSGIMIDIDGDGNPENIDITTEGAFTIDMETLTMMDGTMAIIVTIDLGGIPFKIESQCVMTALKQ